MTRQDDLFNSAQFYVPGIQVKFTQATKTTKHSTAKELKKKNVTLLIKQGASSDHPRAEANLVDDPYNKIQLQTEL